MTTAAGEDGDRFERAAVLLAGAQADGFADALRTTLALVCEETGAHGAVLVHTDDGVATAAHAWPAGADEASARVVRMDCDGGRWTLSLREPAAPGAANRFARLLGAALARDATSDRRLIEELTDARDRAEAADEAKSRFLSRASHELRTPLSVVTGFTQLLSTAEDPHEIREYVDRIGAASTHLLGIVDDLLDSVRLAEPFLPDRLRPVDLAALVREVVRLVEADAAASGVRLRLDLDGAPLVFVAEPLLRRVVLNLLTNAVKYNRPGGEVEITVVGRGSDVVLEVADTGRGIPPDLRDRLFVPFERLGAEDSGIEGSGLGLTIALAAVQRMRGRLEYLDRPDGGTRAVVTLPRGAAPAGGLVLVVEDDPGLRRLLCRVLERPGRTLVTAQDGREALQAMRTSPPAVALVDLGLPDMDGVDLIRLIRDAPVDAGRHRLVVALTGDGTDESARAAWDAGADDVLLKPVDPAVLVAMVDAAAPVV